MKQAKWITGPLFRHGGERQLKWLLVVLVALLGTGLPTGRVHALHNFALKQQGELPGDQYLDLVDPGHFQLNKLVVKFSEDTRIRLRDSRLVSLEGRSLSTVESFLKAHPEIKVARLIDTMKEDELEAYVARGERLSGCDVADLNNYYLFNVTERNADPKGLLAELLKLELVQTGYYEPISAPATCSGDPAPATPDYQPDQDYREAAPTGIDIDYAWSFSPSYGKGRSVDRFQDLEWGWCEGHEDLALIIRNGPDAAADSSSNHGTAVVSIVGACDDGKGVAGLTPNVTMTARVVSNHTSTATALLAIGADLVTGEVYLIEMHAQGPDPGTTCTCNCAQFRYVAEEYWQGNFDAILANSANGRYCIEAAGNGSMDLNWYGYNGAFDPWTRDSQAILVGAGTSGAVHDPECFTNYGARISAYSWGDGITAAGYGNLSDQTGCEQDYTWSFGGTSGASPIVTGAAISLSTIHNAMFGSYLSPVDLRARLQTNGTPQGPNDTWKTLNVQPNLKGILAPDLTPYNPGWESTITPSDVTGTSTVPGALWPAPANTYFDFAWINWSHYSTVASSPATLTVDDAPLFTGIATNQAPWSYATATDWAAPIRGGLHYIKLDCDPNNLHVDESVEGNNRMVLTYRWQPTALWSDTPAYFSRGPRKDPWGAGTYAQDGYGNGGDFPGWWDVTGVMSSGGGDYDINLYNTNPTSSSGWDYPVASSANVSTVDFVGCNNNAVSDGDFTGVINANDTDSGYIVERQGSQYLGSPQLPPVNAGNFDLSFGEILDVYEIDCVAGQPVWFDIDVTFGEADLALFIFGPASTYFARVNALWTLNSGGPGADEAGIFMPGSSGYHGVVVCKNLAADLANSASYSLIWGTPAGDLTSYTPAGWSQPIVARNNGVLPFGVLPSILNEGTSRVDAGLTNIGGLEVAAGSNLAYYLDGLAVFTSGDLPAYSAGIQIPMTNRLIGTVKGGRHELGMVLDLYNEAAEQPPQGESNNGCFRQYAWAPLALENGVPLARTPAPNWINLNNPDCWAQVGYNQDAYTYTTGDWTAVAAMPLDPAAQLDMLGFSYASTDPTTALLGAVNIDYNAPGRITMTLANGLVTGYNQPFDAGVMSNFAWPQTPSTGYYTVQLAQAQSVLNLGAPVVGTLAGDPDMGGQLVHIHEIYLDAGTSVPLTLFNNSSVDLGVSVFSAGQDFVARSGALATFDTGGAGAGEMGSYIAPVTGTYGLAVYRSGTTDLGPDAAYSLVLGSWAPAAVSGLAITLTETDGSDEYLHVNLQWDDVTTDVNMNPLVVDHYNVYWSYLPDGPWYLVTSPTVSEVLDLAAYVGYWTNSYYLVKAVDGNGSLLTGSPPAPEPDGR